MSCKDPAFCLLLPNSGITGTGPHTWFFMWVTGIEPGFLSPCGKHVNGRAISLALEIKLKSSSPSDRHFMDCAIFPAQGVEFRSSCILTTGLSQTLGDCQAFYPLSFSRPPLFILYHGWSVKFFPTRVWEAPRVATTPKHQTWHRSTAQLLQEKTIRRKHYLAKILLLERGFVNFKILQISPLNFIYIHHICIYPFR